MSHKILKAFMFLLFWKLFILVKNKLMKMLSKIW